MAETFNLHSLDGYSTGGTLHLIANNQVGFTTDPAEGRSTRYSSDLAKGFDVPIVHVNADDPEAALTAIRLALAYREEFGHDVVVDLVGYRRFGHNEQDEASYTQPLQSERIEQQVPVRESYGGPAGGGGCGAAGRLRPHVRGHPRRAPRRARRAPHELRGADPARGDPDEDGHRRRRGHGGGGRSSPPARRPAARGARRLRDQPEARTAARAPSREPPRGRVSTGGMPRPLRSRRSSRTGSPSASRGRTPSAAPSRTGRRYFTTRTPGRRTRRSKAFPPPRRRSRSTTRPSRSTRRSRSSTGTRSPLPTRSCSGRRSSATS